MTTDYRDLNLYPWGDTEPDHSRVTWSFGPTTLAVVLVLGFAMGWLACRIYLTGGL